MKMAKAFANMWQEGYDLGWSEGISEGISQGISQGISEGISQGISQAIKSLEQTLGFSTKEAMDVLLVPKEEREKYLKSNEPEQES